MSQQHALSSNVRIGHVHLRVADLERSTAFYRDAIGFTVTLDGRTAGLPVVFLAAGDYHHHLALNTFEGAGGAPPASGSTGLYHMAIVYPDRVSLGRAVERLMVHGVAIDSGRDHGATVSVYLKDPDRNGVELYYDRPRGAWTRPDGGPVLKNDRFDPAELLATAHSQAERAAPSERSVLSNPLVQ